VPDRSDLDLDAFRARLLARREELTGRLGGLAAAPERGSGISFGKRIGDGTVEAGSRLTDIGLGRALETEQERIERALVKLGDGTYGYCDACGEPIPVKRLEARPESVLCVACAARAPRV